MGTSRDFGTKRNSWNGTPSPESNVNGQISGDRVENKFEFHEGNDFFMVKMSKPGVEGAPAFWNKYIQNNSDDQHEIFASQLGLNSSPLLSVYILVLYFK